MLLMHSIPSIFNGGVNDFGNLYLNQQGFGGLGLPLAWAIKISPVVAAGCLLFEKYVIWEGAITIIILIAGISDEQVLKGG
ncbi:hypothetical protein [Emticicia fluvialis]|uniref:hypothetical protein n=1 Tax=Emticicia fluvialis TaxID=2974474 RepID=UPI0021651E53|nr:hypothetical protein [Emticicia fluvialis]